MNNIQKRAFEHLTDEFGSGQRQQALAILTREGFFTQKSELESRDLVTSFIEEYGPHGQNLFCDDGIGRFLQALDMDVRQAAPRGGPNSARLYANIEFTLFRDSGTSYAEDSDTFWEEVEPITERLVPLVALARGDGWRIENVTLVDCDVP